MTAPALPISWSRDGLLVVDKPSGVPSQPAPGRNDDVVARLRPTHPHAAVAHRLDLPASGLLLLVTDPRWHAPIAEAFRTRTIRRTYRAVLAGDGLAPGERLRWDAKLDGQEAVSEGIVEGAQGGLLAVTLWLRTGRTHQLRRHAAGAGVPILGDRRHGGPVGRWAPRLLLHATRLAFTHPADGQPVQVDAPLPAPLDAWWARAGGPDTPPPDAPTTG